MATKKVTGIMKPKTLTEEAASFFKKKSMARTDLIKQIWVYIKEEELNDGRTITLDEDLREVLCTKKKTIDMTELAGLVSNCFEE